MNDITLRKSLPVPATAGCRLLDTLGAWLEAYFAVEATTAYTIHGHTRSPGAGAPAHQSVLF